MSAPRAPGGAKAGAGARVPVGRNVGVAAAQGGQLETPKRVRDQTPVIMHLPMDYGSGGSGCFDALPGSSLRLDERLLKITKPSTVDE